MADPINGNGRVNITGQMLLTALVALIVAWAAWVTAQALLVSIIDRRLDGIVSTLSCTQRDGNKTPGEGK